MNQHAHATADTTTAAPACTHTDFQNGCHVCEGFMEDIMADRDAEYAAAWMENLWLTGE